MTHRIAVTARTTLRRPAEGATTNGHDPAGGVVNGNSGLSGRRPRTGWPPAPLTRRRQPSPRAVLLGDPATPGSAAPSEDAKRLAERLAGLFGTEPEFISELSLVLATHTGPGTLVAGGLPRAALGGAYG